MTKTIKGCLRWIFAVLFYCFFSSSFAQEGIAPLPSAPARPVLHEVLYQTQSEIWVSSKTAKVIVNISALMNENQLSNAHADILVKLSELAKSEWHITQFNRSPNDSGLEQLQVTAETRLAEGALSAIRAQAKKISKPGETFSVDIISFEPALSEIELGKKQLRENIYQNINNELSTLNKIYPNQHWVVHKIDFSENNIVQPVPAAGMLMAGAVTRNTAVNTAVTVADKLTLSADVVLAVVNQPAIEK